MVNTFRDHRGLTLIELMVALVSSALVISGLYRIFVSQQKTYVAQEQVIEVKQDLRGGVMSLIRELRMAGFGNVSMALPLVFPGGQSYENVVNSNTPSQGWVTIVMALDSNSRGARLKSIVQAKKPARIQVSSVADFDTNRKSYISIGGVESKKIIGVNAGTKELILEDGLIYTYPAETPIYPVRAISYGGGLRDENTGEGSQSLWENVEDVRFQFFDGNGNPAASDAAIRLMGVTVTARAAMPDPNSTSGTRYQRRQISSNIQLRNPGTWQ